ncbi:hypothetical protein HSRCO_0464 [Halanaeroarchaeum sp. HSR-CO]|nr:hypothetical protein HSRCO_0464 [Halanaeroarchaeum sp. HSR-CO]
MSSEANGDVNQEVQRNGLETRSSPSRPGESEREAPAPTGNRSDGPTAIWVGDDTPRGTSVAERAPLSNSFERAPEPGWQRSAGHASGT